MPDANRLENFAKYAAIVSALIAAAVGIGQFRRGVSQSVRELEWKQADMARTIVNAMLNDEGWDAMTMLDWEEGRTYEVAPGTRVRILPPDVPEAIEASLRVKGRQRGRVISSASPPRANGWWRTSPSARALPAISMRMKASMWRISRPPPCSASCRSR